MNSTDSLRQKQIAIETSLKQRGRTIVPQIMEIYESNDLCPRYVYMVESVFLPLIESIKLGMRTNFTFKERDKIDGYKPAICKVLAGLDEKEIASVILYSVFTSVHVVNLPLIQLCNSLSDNLFTAFNIEEEIKYDLKINIAFRLLSMFRDTFPSLITWELEDISEKKTQYLVKVPEGKREFSKFKDYYKLFSEIFNSPVVPMVYEPKPWTSLSCGGYLTDSHHNLVRNKSPLLTEEISSPDVMPEVYDVVSLVQSTPWSIDLDSYETILWCIDNDVAVGKLPNSETENTLKYPLSDDIKSFSDDQKETLHKWYKINDKIRSSNQSKKSRRLISSSVLKVVDQLVSLNIENVYFPHNLDYRGRVYPITPVFNPQGLDYIKSLLKFSNKLPIDNKTARDWLAIHGANLYGKDKLRLEDRVKWVESKELEIRLSVGMWKDSTWWREADNPFQFLSWCREWVGFLDQGYGYLSGIPVDLDGSCSGIQHFSAMMRDKLGAESVNLIPSYEPEDVYKVVSERCVELLKKNSKSELANLWLQVGVDRRLTKRPVMTLPYGLTIYTCKSYIKDFILENNINIFESINHAVDYKSKVMWEAIHDTLNGAIVAMDYLKDCARKISRTKGHINWTTPLGFPVYQSPYTKKPKTPLIKYYGMDGEKKMIKLSYHRQDHSKPNHRRNVSSISPNFVHSYDACHLMMSLLKANNSGITDFRVIHDSFGTHAANCEEFRNCIRQSFYDMYSESNPLREFYEYHQDSGIRPPPSYGMLDLSLILQSDYAFS